MDNSVCNLQIFIKKINKELYKLKSCASNIWLYNNNCEINKTNSLLVYINLFRGGLACAQLQIFNN